MKVIQIVEAARNRVLQEVNMEFDLLISDISKLGISDSNNCQVPAFEVKYPLSAGSGIFKGQKPIAVYIDNKKHDVRTWKQLTEVVLKECIKDENNKKALFGIAGKVSGRKRELLSVTDTAMRSPIKIADNLYMETHYDTETLLRILTSRILAPIGYDYSGVYVAVRNN